MENPKIRFKGFTKDWEQRKLGDVFKEYSEKNHTELSALTIIQGGGTVKREDSDRNLMYDTSNLSNYKMVRKDDFIVHLRSFEGGLEKSSLDGIISPAYHTFHSDMADSRFYYPYFRSDEFIKHKLVSHVYGIRDGRSIDIDGMKTIEIPYTSIEEQRKIGDYLDCLDHLITLHQRKCEQTKNLKKYMLQKMFPQNGAKVPEIRFNGFTHDWEQRKFGDVVQVRRGLTYKPSDVQETGVRVLRSSNINEDTFVCGNDDVFVNPKTVNIDTVKQNDILITSANGSSRLVGKHALIKGIPDESAVHGGFMLLGITKNYDFINASMNSSWYIRFINIYVTGGNGAIGNLSKSDLDEQLILVPSDLEQKKIGEYFTNLDHLITLHQRQCDELKKMKKYMLQNMFI